MKMDYYQKHKETTNKLNQITTQPSSQQNHQHYHQTTITQNHILFAIIFLLCFCYVIGIKSNSDDSLYFLILLLFFLFFACSLFNVVVHFFLSIEYSVLRCAVDHQRLAARVRLRGARSAFSYFRL